MKLIVNIIIAAIFILGCDHQINHAGNVTEFTTEFKLKDSEGVSATTFVTGEPIRLEYEVVNVSGKRQPFTLPDTGPIVEFEIRKQGVSQGTSMDGLNYAPKLQTDTLETGVALSASYNWYSSQQHTPLSPGQYVAVVDPRFEFSEAITPGNESVNLTIIEAAGTDTVRITNQQADSIQLDPFVLNDVTLEGNILTLNLSFGGGCEEHDFELFMSPAAFLESNPVQANLFLRHDSHGDACEAYLTQDVSFNLQPLLDLHLTHYGSPAEIILNIFHYFEAQPDSSLSTRYQP